MTASPMTRAKTLALELERSGITLTLQGGLVIAVLEHDTPLSRDVEITCDVIYRRRNGMVKCIKNQDNAVEDVPSDLVPDVVKAAERDRVFAYLDSSETIEDAIQTAKDWWHGNDAGRVAAELYGKADGDRHQLVTLASALVKSATTFVNECIRQAGTGRDLSTLANDLMGDVHAMEDAPCFKGSVK